MEQPTTNKLIGYAVLALIAYYLLRAMVPFLIYGVLGFVAWRLYTQHRK